MKIVFPTCEAYSMVHDHDVPDMSCTCQHVICPAIIVQIPLCFFHSGFTDLAPHRLPDTKSEIRSFYDRDT